MSAEPQMTLPAVPEAPQQNGMVAMMERLALNPDLPVDKLEKLLDMQLRVREIEAEQSFNAAMARVQANLPVVLKDGYNEQTKSPYATVSAVAAAIKPVYTAQGFSTTFSEGKSEKADHVRILGTLMHADGHKKDHYYTDVAIDKTGIKGNDNKTLTHAEGSSFTYGRRYLICLMFDVATGNDTDGNAPGTRGGDFITTDQVTLLEDRVAEIKTNKAVFLRWLGVESFEQLRTKDYERALNQLDVLNSRNNKK